MSKDSLISTVYFSIFSFIVSFDSESFAFSDDFFVRFNGADYLLCCLKSRTLLLVEAGAGAHCPIPPA